jgi:hypothetical protein
MRPRGPSWPLRFPPHRKWEHVPAPAIREMFRHVFARWGLPERVRVDNGYPWGTPRDLPPELALWLIGLGVGVIWNPAGQPTCNPKVERCNGLTQQWGELHRCADGAGAAAVLAEVARIQREEYPAIRGRTRLEVFPQLKAPRRAYRRSREAALWDLSRVDVFLAQGCWKRRVDCNGRISIYGHGRSVGRAWAHQDVGLRFEASSRCWMVSDQAGGLIKRMPAAELTRERIMALAVSRRR